jgi:hypothetical protein
MKLLADPSNISAGSIVKDDTAWCTAEPLQGHVQALNDIICDLVIYIYGRGGTHKRRWPDRTDS